MKTLKFLSVLASIATALTLSACSLLPTSGPSSTPDAETTSTQTPDATMSTSTSTPEPSTEWPEAFRSQFMSSCTAAAHVNKEYCECTYDAARAKYTVDEFSKISLEAMGGDNEASEAINTLAAQCIDKL